MSATPRFNFLPVKCNRLVDMAEEFPELMAAQEWQYEKWGHKVVKFTNDPDPRQPLQELLIIDDPRSQTRILHLGRQLEVVGFGHLKSPGHPNGNQMLQRQLPILRSIQSGNVFPVFRQAGKQVKCLGYQKAVTLRKQVSSEGFAQFVAVLKRQWQKIDTASHWQLAGNLYNGYAGRSPTPTVLRASNVYERYPPSYRVVVSDPVSSGISEGGWAPSEGF